MNEKLKPTKIDYRADIQCPNCQGKSWIITTIGIVCTVCREGITLRIAKATDEFLYRWTPSRPSNDEVVKRFRERVEELQKEREKMAEALNWIEKSHHQDGCGYSRQPNPYTKEANESKCTCGKFQLKNSLERC